MLVHVELRQVKVQLRVVVIDHDAGLQQDLLLFELTVLVGSSVGTRTRQKQSTSTLFAGQATRGRRHRRSSKTKRFGSYGTQSGWNKTQVLQQTYQTQDLDANDQMH